MKEIEIENLIVSGFQKELMSEEPTYLYELFMITLRSIYPNISKDANVINYDRFSEELKLWRHYRRGGNKAINGLVIRGEKTDAFDESASIRTLPIFIANQNIDNAIEEAVSNVYYFTSDIDSIFSSIVYGILTSNKTLGFDDRENLEILKEKIICFKTMDYLITINRDSDVKYLIKIENKKIDIIQAIDRTIAKIFKDETEDKKNIETSVVNSEKENIELDNILVNFIEDTFKVKLSDSMKNFIEQIINIEDTYLRSIGKYLYKLRKGRISPKALEFEKEEDVSIFSLSEGQEFNNSILGISMLKKVECRDGFELRYVKTRSGTYRFFRKKEKK